mmetsp:Transcript_22958/g.67774  ORF Transcript_22958/g.67774 Transcript_22958/m.67774 type:complete len:113 (-) Transcript_22958:13-351(-)
MHVKTIGRGASAGSLGGGGSAGGEAIDFSSGLGVGVPTAEGVAASCPPALKGVISVVPASEAAAVPPLPPSDPLAASDRTNADESVVSVDLLAFSDHAADGALTLTLTVQCL